MSLLWIWGVYEQGMNARGTEVLQTKYLFILSLVLRSQGCARACRGIDLAAITGYSMGMHRRVPSRRLPRPYLIAALALLFTLGGNPGAAVAQNQGQQQPSENDGNVSRAHWRATTPGGTFLVPLRSVASASTHEFIVQGVGRVYEMTVGTVGHVTARFYTIESTEDMVPSGTAQRMAESIRSRMDSVTSRVGGEEILNNAVLKDYPIATHSRIVEYRLSNRSEVDKLFKSLDISLIQNRGRTVSAQ